MSASDSLPVYDGPKCRICCDLMPNRQIPLPNGKWVDVQKQGKMTLSLAVWLSDVYESAKTCVNCKVMIEALECFEGKEPRLEDEMFTVDGRVGTSLKLEYNLADDEYLRFIEVFSDTESESCLGRATLIEVDIDPRKAAEIAKRRLRECIDSHDECRVGRRGFIPTRVVDVGTGDGLPRLVETTEDMKDTDYVALSYCWGLAQSLTTTKAILPKRLEGIPWEDIPKTLHEAIEFVQHLGLSYIWIDALCIIQDDGLDWEKEAAQMKNVYENALFTLSATSAPDVATGCFLARNNPVHELHSAKPQHTYYARRPCFDTHSKLFSYSVDTEIEMDNYPAMKRGWIYQERLLSQRILYCAYDELIWECRNTITCECNPTSLHRHHGGNAIVSYKRQMGHLSDPTQFNKKNSSCFPIIDLWLSLVQSYSQRVFTKYTDRLIALSGIAQKFQPLSIGNYYAGIWSSEIHHQLAWTRDANPKALRVKEAARIPGSPSWSWCSINQPCVFDDVMNPPRISTRLTALNYKAELSSPDPTGPVSYARLTLSGPCIEAKIVLGPPVEENPSSPLKAYISLCNKQYLITPDIPQWHNAPQSADSLAASDEVSCLEIYITKKGFKDNVNVKPDSPWDDPEHPDQYYNYRFPWLVLKWSPPHDAYRRVGIVNFANRPSFDQEEQAPGEMMRHAAMRVVDIV
ncbi:hypothetical protein QC764_603200 [Podospora pseudoanserina]|uniref:Heterokaryon incompatibility domain-containing protein n=1 Tax=Podospora pseudoanserina TaxID=2609844 RepID=A0ABR0HSN5_9PEZI|nr:hypothetical protein QC764_603200 [Podospora pseudoanserina]